MQLRSLMDYFPLIYYFSIKGDNWGTDKKQIENKAFINGLLPFSLLVLSKGR